MIFVITRCKCITENSNSLLLQNSFAISTKKLLLHSFSICTIRIINDLIRSNNVYSNWHNIIQMVQIRLTYEQMHSRTQYVHSNDFSDFFFGSSLKSS